jgi:hypothetical protein
VPTRHCGLLCQPRVVMMMEKLVEWLAGENEVLVENLPQCRFVHHKPHKLTRREPGYNLLVSWDWVSPLGTAVTTGLLYQPWMIDVVIVGWWNENWQGNRSTRRKPTPVPLCSPQIPHDLIRARTWAATVGSRRLTAWAMARPSYNLNTFRNSLHQVAWFGY